MNTASQPARAEPHAGVVKMTDTLFNEYRSTYINPNIEGAFCLGSRQTCSHFSDDGVTFVPWNSIISEERYLSVKKLYLKPTVSQLKKAHFPTYITNLNNLWYLSMPCRYINKITNTSLPDCLRSIMITTNYEYENDQSVLQISWQDNAVFPNVTALIFTADFTPKGNAPYMKINSQMFPNLEFVRLVCDNKGKILDTLKNLDKLRLIELENIRNSDPFDLITDSVEGIRISAGGAKFNASKIVKLQNLNTIWLHGMKCEIDCSMFSGFKNLRELIIMNSKKITHPEQLLQCKTLTSIKFVNCGNPFNKGLKDKIKHTLTGEIEIDFS
jgi:hypothetical protein